MGKPADQWSRKDVVDLLGVHNAIRDGEMSVEAVFSTPATGENLSDSVKGVTAAEKQNLFSGGDR